MTNNKPSLDERIGNWQLGTFVWVPTELFDGNKEGDIVRYYQEFVNDLIADRQRLLDLVDELQKQGREMAAITMLNAQFSKMAISLERENKAIKERNQELEKHHSACAEILENNQEFKLALRVAIGALDNCKCVHTGGEGTQYYIAQEAIGRIKSLVGNV